MRSRIPAIALLLLIAVPGSASTRHVDAEFGIDTGDGSDGAPWHSIQHGVSRLEPGDTLVLHPGVYAESVVVTVAGTADRPIAIRAEPGAVLESPNPAASLSAFDIAAGAEHLEIAGFTARGGYHEAVFVRPGARHISIRDCEIHDNQAGIWIAGASDIEVDGCDIHDNVASGIRIAGASSDVLVRNTSSRGNDDGRGCLGDADGFTVEDSATGVVFEGCVAEANGEDGFDLQGDDVTIIGSQSLANGCAGLKLATNAVIHASLIAGNRTGLTATSRDGTARFLSVMNTTVADNSGTQILVRNPPASDGGTAEFDVTLRNVVASGEGKALEVEVGVNLVEDHNIFYRPGTTDGVIVVHQPIGDALRYTGQQINTGAWATHTAGGAATWAIDPQFTADGAYRGEPTSPMIDTGAATGAMDADLAGLPRPVGNAIDRGAHESSETLTNQLPWPDPGPDREVAFGGRITFHSYGSFDPDGDPLILTWHFADDDTTASGESAAHTFRQPGEHLVSLTASDGQGTRTRTARVIVAESASIPSACPATPRAGCLEADRSVVKATDRRPDGASVRDRLVWKWISRQTSDPDTWGSPLDGETSYQLCVYGDEGLRAALDVAPPDTCARSGCWRATRKGFEFRDINTDGVSALRTIACTTRPTTKFVLVARGPSSFVDASTPLVLQLARRDDETACWQSRIEPR